jgi:hypothetical protein
MNTVTLTDKALITLHDLLNGSLYEEGRPFVDEIIREAEEREKTGRRPYINEVDIYAIGNKVAIKHFSTK